MQFNFKDLRGLLLCIKNNNLNYISIKKDGFELMVNKKIIITGINKSNFFHYSDLDFDNNTKQKTTNKLKLSETKISTSNKKNKSNKNLDTYFTVVSPMVGTFYRSPAPDEPSFVELNDHVEKRQTVCIIEAMKLMNEIEAEIDGNIVEILVKDGDVVDSGQALMKVKSSQN